ncbi:MAG: hypothetical protein HY942_09530 [Gammaproteobacteria bacterium]|nr:hypothetical protein [Gammaproteobacteria bacterium]
MKGSQWKVQAFSLATTLGIAYVLCAVFDTLFPPYGLLRVLAPVSPWPIMGSAAGLALGFAMFAIAGFVFGAIHAIAWRYWSKTL